eukprot:10577165-Alexandrium_andersonii.AAC.1
MATVARQLSRHCLSLGSRQRAQSAARAAPVASTAPTTPTPYRCQWALLPRLARLARAAILPVPVPLLWPLDSPRPPRA